MSKLNVMQWHKQVTSLQIDISSHCNARCGACIRNNDGGETDADLPLDHFDLNLWKRIANKDTKKYWIRKLTLNGNWGDPMMHPHLIEMMQIWYEAHPMSIPAISTNGSMRGPKFWYDLASIMRKFPNHKVDFSIDGLEDTHSIYRRKTDFNKIIENIKSFVKADGHAVIKFTMFKHNEHQHEQIKELAKELGVNGLDIRESHSKHMQIKDKDEEYEIVASKDIPESRYVLRDDPIRSLSPSTHQILTINDMYDDYMDNSDEHKTKCPWYNAGEVQIDPWGTIWPCCHVSMFGIKMKKTDMSEVDDTVPQARIDNNLKHSSLYDILSSDWYNEHLKLKVKNAKWQICRQNCGVQA